MLNKLSEAQRSMLQAAAKRDDRLVTPPPNARAAAVKILAVNLIDAGLGKEIKARNGAPIWRKDAASGASYALKVTAKGLESATALIEAADSGSAPSIPTVAKKKGAPTQRVAPVVGEPTPGIEASSNQLSPIQTRAPRATSKLGRVLDMLAADTGATIGELTAATGWLEHTTRAALTGLRHRGYDLSRTRKERDGASVYRVVARGGEAA
jgi:hypothetical protein